MLATSSLSVVLVFISSSALLVALPDISRDLHTTAPQSTWVLLGYMLTTTTLILVFGRLADLAGRRRLYLAGIVVFLLAAVACGLAPTAPILIAARLVQGVGAAAIVTNTTALLTDVFPRPILSVGLGLNATVAAVGQIIGPLVGGLVTETFGWRWLFLAGVPVSLASLGWSLRLIPARATPRTGERFDGVGAALSVATVGLLVGAVSAGGSAGWSSPQVVALAGGAVIACWLFVRSQRSADHPLIDGGIFRDRATVTLFASAGLCALSSYALVLLASLWFQAVGDRDAVGAALGILPSPIGTTLAAAAAGVLARRFPARVLSTAGMLLIAAGACLVAIAVGQMASATLVGLGLAAAGVGTGIFMTPSTAALMSRVPAARRGIANAIRSALQNAGFLFSTALGLAIATSGLTAAQQASAYDGSLLALSPADVATFVDGIRLAGLLFALCAVVGAAILALRPFGPPRPLIPREQAS